MAAVTICGDFGAHVKKICHCFHFFPFCLPWSDRSRCHDLCFAFLLMLSFKPAFSLSSFTLIKRLFSSSPLWAIALSFVVVQLLNPRHLFFYPMDCSPPGASVHGIPQARILEWVVISLSRGSSWPRDRTWFSCTGKIILYHWATSETQKAPLEQRSGIIFTSKVVYIFPSSCDSSLFQIHPAWHFACCTLHIS